MLHHIRRHVSKDPWWHVFGLCIGLAFALLLMLERLYPTYLDVIDKAFEVAIRPYQTLGHIEFFLVITVLGSTIGIIVLGLGAAFFLRRNRFAVLQLFLLLLWTSVSMGIAKTFVERARPDALLWLDPLNTYSFPSGHATLSTALYGFLAVCLYRRSRSARGRFLSILVPIVIIVLVGLSRIILNYHYFTDVLGGVLLGLFWLAVVFMLPKYRSSSSARK